MVNNFKGIWIPLELIEMDISWTKRILIAEISQLELLDKGCVASNGHFSSKLKITNQAVSKALNELSKDGIITIDNAQTKRNFGRTITINFSKSAINFSKSGVHQSGESKENKSFNKTFNNPPTPQKGESNISKSKKKTVNERKKNFYNKVKEHVGKYQKETLRQFFDHWSTVGDNEKKMAFEKCKTWNTSKRLATWAKNNFNGTETLETKVTPKMKIIKIKETQETTDTQQEEVLNMFSKINGI